MSDTVTGVSAETPRRKKSADKTVKSKTVEFPEEAREAIEEAKEAMKETAQATKRAWERREKPPEPRPEFEPFARKLRDAMIAKAMTASDVARYIWGEMTDYRGYKVARNRDRIGHYLAGLSLPDPENFKKLAQAVGLTEDELRAGYTPPVREFATVKGGAAPKNGRPPASSNDLEITKIENNLYYVRVPHELRLNVQGLMDLIRLIDQQPRSGNPGTLDTDNTDASTKTPDAA